MSAQKLATTEGKPPLSGIVQMRWSRMQMVSEMISANVGILPHKNELLTKNARFSVKRQVEFWSGFGVNQEEAYVFYVSSKSFAQQI